MTSKLGLPFAAGLLLASGIYWAVGPHSGPAAPAPPVVIVQTPPPPPAALLSSVQLPPSRYALLASQSPGIQVVPAATASSTLQPPAPAPVPVPPVPPASAAASGAPAEAHKAAPAAVSVSSMPALPPPLPERLSVLESPPVLSPAEQADRESAALRRPGEPREPRSVTLPAGTMITVRLQRTINSAQADPGADFQVTLDAPLIVSGLAIAERGSLHKGKLADVQRAGRAGNRAKLALELTELNLSDGQTVPIRTDAFVHQGEGADRGSSLRKTATLAVIAASIGAMASGGKGAAIGGAIGAGAGAGASVLIKNPEAVLSSETRLTFRLKEPVTITEKLP